MSQLATPSSHPALNLGDAHDLDFAARAIALGAIVGHPAGNIYVFGARADDATLRYVNTVKGRPALQTGTVVTTPEHIAGIFDWSKLPRGLAREKTLALIDGLLELGPFGFRGPARPGLPHFMTADDHGVRTVQTVSPGKICPTNQLYERVLDEIPEPYLYGTSANRSRHLTGAVDEPVHHRLAPLRAEFGAVPGFFWMRSADEQAMQQRYPLHAPTSATLISFHKLGPDGPLPAVVVERHGSLELEHVRRVARSVGLDVYLAPSARQRLSARDYARAA